MKNQKPALDLGELQGDVVRATANLKRTRAAAERANAAFADAEETYTQARRAMQAGAATVFAQTKMPL